MHPSRLPPDTRHCTTCLGKCLVLECKEGSRRLAVGGRRLAAGSAQKAEGTTLAQALGSTQRSRDLWLSRTTPQTCSFPFCRRQNGRKRTGIRRLAANHRPAETAKRRGEEV